MIVRRVLAGGIISEPICHDVDWNRYWLKMCADSPTLFYLINYVRGEHLQLNPPGECTVTAIRTEENGASKILGRAILCHPGEVVPESFDMRLARISVRR